MKPAVIEHDGEIAVWGDSPDDQFGTIFSADAGVETGLAILRLAARLNGRRIDIRGAKFEIATPTDVSEEHAARITITVEGAPLAFHLDADKFVELAAAMGAAARDVG